MPNRERSYGEEYQYLDNFLSALEDTQATQPDSTVTDNQGNYPGIEGGARPLTLMQRLAAGFASTEEGRENILGGMGGEGRAPEPISRPGKPDDLRGLGYLWARGHGLKEDPKMEKHLDEIRGEFDYRDLPGDIADEVGPSLAPIGGAIGGTAGLSLIHI